MVFGAIPETEAEFQSWIVDYARVNGWRVWYMPDWVYRLIARDMQRTRIGKDWPDKGFPDLWLVREGELVVLEVKSATGSVKKEQKAWIADLAAAGIVARVVRPKDREMLESLLSRKT